MQTGKLRRLVTTNDEQKDNNCCVKTKEHELDV